MIDEDFDSFDDSSLSFQVQRVTGNTYLKKYKLRSPLIFGYKQYFTN